MTKTMSVRVNNDVYTMFTDVCNNEGVSIAQKMKQLVTDCITPSCKTENKFEPTGNIDEDRKLLDSIPREDLEKSLSTLQSKNRIEKSLRMLEPTTRKTLDEKIRVLDSKKKVEPEFTQSKDGLGEFMKSLMNDSRKNNYTYNQNLVKMAFDPYFKDMKQSITDLNTKFEQKIDLDKQKKKMGCIPSKLSCSGKFV